MARSKKPHFKLSDFYLSISLMLFLTPVPLSAFWIS